MLNDRTTILDIINQSNASMELGMPGNKWIPLTLGVSGTIYTAPADGYVHIIAMPNSVGQTININPFEYYNGKSWSDTWTVDTSYSTSTPLVAWAPFKKGHKFYVYYSGTLKSVVKFSFTYLDRNEPKEE